MNIPLSAGETFPIYFQKKKKKKAQLASWDKNESVFSARHQTKQNKTSTKTNKQTKILQLLHLTQTFKGNPSLAFEFQFPLTVKHV